MAAIATGPVRVLLRGLSVLEGAAPEWDLTSAPADPVELFDEWLRHAADNDVPEPHAMTLSTVDDSGDPDARILILKDVDAAGWHFAASAASPKGRELATRPAAALTFYWPKLVRQVRVRGPVVLDPPTVRIADFLARSIGSRKMASTLRQSQTLRHPDEIDDALHAAAQRLTDDPDYVPDAWTSYAVQPRTVEFWQGDPHRRHLRLRYERIDVDQTWGTSALWP